MGRSSFWDQFKVLVRKNYLLKRRKLRDTIQEVMVPIYFIAILALIKYYVKPESFPAIGNFPESSIRNRTFSNTWNRTILVSPNDSDIRTVMAGVENVISEIAPGSAPEIMYYQSLLAAETAYKSMDPDEIWAGIVFDYNSKGNLSYAIRIGYNEIANTEQSNIYRDQSQCREGGGLDEDKCDANTYLYTGFAILQAAIDTALIRPNLGNVSFSPGDILVQLMPKDKYVPNTNYIQIMSAIYFVIAYSPFINFLTVNLVAEKEKKIKEGMKMMGLKDSAFWASWAFIYTIFITVVTIVVVVIAILANVFLNSNMFLFFLMLFLYGLSMVCAAFALTPFFNKAQIAGALAGLASMMISLLYLLVSLTRTFTATGVTYTIPVWGRWLLCLLSPVAIALALDQAIYLDILGGMNFDTITTGEFPLYAPMVMLVIDSVLYLFLAVYLDNIIPGEYGPHYPPWYIFMPSYWCPGDILRKRSLTMTDKSGGSVDQHGDIEPVSLDVMDLPAIRICNLIKVFKKEKEPIKAVDELSLTIYEDQITAILGHNGAGKTTLLSMLCGLTGPTSGFADILSLDVANARDMGRIRTMLGVCPQYNILFDLLTCREHLILFAKLKGVYEESIEEEVKTTLENIDLIDKTGTRAEDLSGGQKRKLAVGIALIGNPKIVILDEPTAGMDPYSRRHLWSILKQKKKGRVILLTTHFMDEADILADRKAILTKGKLRCCGSSLFLKNRFGIGYHLNMNVSRDCETEKVGEMVSQFVQGAEINRLHGKELSVTLPMNEAARFADLFHALEENTSDAIPLHETLGIRSYGVSMTSLEEVFLKLEEAEEVEDLADLAKESGRTSPTKYRRVPTADSQLQQNNFDQTPVNLGQGPVELTNNTTNNASSDKKNLNKNFNYNRFWALCKIRFLINIRSKMLQVFQLVLPVIFVIIGLLANKSSSPDLKGRNPSPLPLGSFYYARMKNGTVSGGPAANLPSLLVKNSAGAGGNKFLDMLSKFYYSESYTDTDTLLDVAPHYVGLDLQQITYGPKLSCDFLAVYNDSATHGIPALINLMSNSLLKTAEVMAGINTSSVISISSLPWPAQSEKYDLTNAVFSSVILLSMAFTVIPGGFAVEIVRDRQCKARSQLRVSGVPFSVYWGSYFFTDFMKNLLPAVLAVTVIFVVKVPSLMGTGAIVSFLLASLTYIPANILFSYALSFMFNDHETAQSVVVVIFFFAGFMLYLPVALIDSMTSETTAALIHTLCCIFDPPYTIFGAIYYIDKVYRAAEFKLEIDKITIEDYFKWENHIVITYIMPFFHIFGLLVLLRILDVRSTGGNIRDVFTRSKNITATDDDLKSLSEENSDVIVDEDDDVAEERRTVAAYNPHVNRGSSVAITKNLRKEFDLDSKKNKGCLGFGKKTANHVKVAVRNLSLAVNTGEVFGLLGPNGAGKTTTLNMMTADVAPTKGKVIIGGHDIRSNMSDAFQEMGYCPQHDALWDTITLKEHLECYAAIRGIPKNEIQDIIKFFTEHLKLDEHNHKHSKKLSGGTRRKLSYAISMLGKPQVVLLDEPSTGMDPQSKRFLWDTISQSFQNSERGAILTTHYMEEADALCSRIGILVNGKLMCLGSSQHLKDKYGSGYLLEVKLAVTPEMVSMDTVGNSMVKLHQYVAQLFPDAACMERFGERSQYKIPTHNVTSLAKAFAALEEGKKYHSIEEYTFSQATLEQVFLDFAKKQLDDIDTEPVEENELSVLLESPSADSHNCV